MGLRIIGFLMITGSGAFVGNIFAGKLYRRSRHLRLCWDFISVFIAELQTSASPVEIILRSIADRRKFAEMSFIRECITLCENGVALPGAWSLSVGEDKKLLLTAAERQELERLGDILGQYDVLRQSALLKNAQAYFFESAQEAEEKNKRCARPYRQIGFLCGLAVSVLLL